MNKQYDFLASDKEPFIYFEKTIIKMDDGFLTALSGKEGRFIIPPSSHLVMMLGHGTSITQEAMIFSAQNDMDIAFVKGGSNIHSIMKETRMQDPYRLVNQVKNQERYKLEIAQELLKLRFLLLGYDNNEVEKIYDLKTVEELILFEARWAKNVYKAFCIKNKVDNFKRDFEGSDVINARLNILNNALYSICTSISLSCHLSPSIGFIHGFSRRGGLVFDLADIIKNLSSFKLSFESKETNNMLLMRELMTIIKKDKSKLIRILINVSLLLGEEFDKNKWSQFYDRFSIK